MPLKGFICPDYGEEPGRENKVSYCLTDCSCPCVAPNVLSAMYEAEKQNPHKGDVISVTQLTGGCKRKTLLERTEDYYVLPDKKLPTFRGSLIHALVEKSSNRAVKKAGWLVEQNMLLPCTTRSGSWTLSGTLDAYDAKRETIFDIKTLQDYAVEKMVKGNNEGQYSNHISDAYVLQLNTYRYMAKKLGLFDAKKLCLQVIGFGRLIITGSAVYLKNRSGKEELYHLPDVPILDDSIIEGLINTEGDEWYRILHKEEPAPVCGQDYAWLCKICQFNGTKHCPDPDAERRGDWF